MNMKPTLEANPHKAIAAQQAQTGLISVTDLSLLTGVEVPKLNNLAKKGLLKSYHEYHGKRFYNFTEIMNWLIDSETNEAKQIILSAIEEEMKVSDCPFSLNVSQSESDGSPIVKIVWKELIAA